MNVVKRIALVLALAAPVIASAGPTLYDMQHSSVLRQRLPPYLRTASGPSQAGRDLDRTPAARAPQDDAKPAATPGAAGDGGSKPTDGNGGK